MDQNPPKKIHQSQITNHDLLFPKRSTKMFNGNEKCKRQLAFEHQNLRVFEKCSKLTEKASLGAGALKVEGPIAQKGSIALEVTMATKPAPTIWHHDTERVQWNTNYVPQPKGEGEEWEQNQQISQAVNSNDPQRSTKKSKAELL